MSLSARPVPTPVTLSPADEPPLRPEFGRIPPRLEASLDHLPVRFIPNRGQTDPAVHFQARSRAGTVFFTPQEIIFSAPFRFRPPPLAPRALLRPEGLSAGPTPGARWGSPISFGSGAAFVSLVSTGRQAEQERVLAPPLIRLTFEGANPAPTLEGGPPLPGLVNFFNGDDPRRWRSNVPAYGAVIYRDLYPGVDLIYRGPAGRLKSEFIIAPGANPNLIRMRYQGVEAVELGPAGSLLLRTATGVLQESPPVIYQEIGPVRRPVSGRYLLDAPAGRTGAGTLPPLIGFALGPYDSAYPLIIDPDLLYSSYLGGSGRDSGISLAVDEAGAIYVTGLTGSDDFPNRNSVRETCLGCPRLSTDVFVTKLLNAGGVYTYGYSTYLGGDGADIGHAIAVDEAGAAYVTGQTSSPNFPLINEIHDNGSTVDSANADVFVTKIISAGGVYTLAYSTHLGGGDQDSGLDIAVDETGAAYISGVTFSDDLPTRRAIQTECASCSDAMGDAFVAQLIRLRNVYTWGYLSYLGGDDSDWGRGIAVDEAGGVSIVGRTSSTDFPTFNQIQDDQGFDDVFVTKIINVGGVYTYACSTYLGGDAVDIGSGIAVNRRGDIYITGVTDSLNFPTRNHIQRFQGNTDAFVTKIITSAGEYTYEYSTYLGGGREDAGYSIAVDRSGNAYVAGETTSPDFPTLAAIQDNSDTDGTSDPDAFVTQIVRAGGVYTWGYSTYLGGDRVDRAGEGNSLAVDSQGQVYLAGETNSTTFPLKNALQEKANITGVNAYDAFVTKISPPPRFYLPLILKR